MTLYFCFESEPDLISNVAQMPRGGFVPIADAQKRREQERKTEERFRWSLPP